jgi:glycine/D-amino acid oxidase-like deaminating enzyme
VAVCKQLDESPFQELSAEEVAARTGSSTHLGGVYLPQAAVVQPAELVDALREKALSRGVRLFEHSPVEAIERGRPARVTTSSGSVLADRIAVATGAWASLLPELARQLVVISSDIVATAPAADAFDRSLAISDSQLQVHYYRHTTDGRLVFGKGGCAIAFGRRVSSVEKSGRRRERNVIRDLGLLYPALGAPLTHSWAGPIDRTASGMPLFGRLRDTPHIVYGVGFGGNGVAPSALGGRILASLALGRDDRYAANGLVDQRTRRFPPEPIRFVGAHLVREAVIHKERAERARRNPGRVAAALAGLAPTGLTPTKDPG